MAKVKQLSRTELELRKIQTIVDFITTELIWSKAELEALFNNLEYEYRITQVDFNKAVLQSGYIIIKTPQTKLEMIFKDSLFNNQLFLDIKKSLEYGNKLNTDGLPQDFIDLITEIFNQKQNIIWQADSERHNNIEKWKNEIELLESKVRLNFFTDTNRVNELVEASNLY
jgi:hypothetical protein